MNKLESIKMRLEYKAVDERDMEYLLQRLERYEEALKEANAVIHDYKEVRGFREGQFDKVAAIIKEALKE